MSQARYSVRAVIAAALFLASASAESQVARDLVQSQTLQALRKTFPNATVKFEQGSGRALEMSGLEVTTAPISRSNPKAVVLDVLSLPEIRNAIGIADEVKSRVSFEILDQRADPLDASKTIVTVRQVVDGLPVFGAQAKAVVGASEDVEVAHPAAYSVHALVPNFADMRTLKPFQQPAVSEKDARTIAVQAYHARVGSDQKFALEGKLFPQAESHATAELFLFDPSSLRRKAQHSLIPTWVVRIGSMVYFIDAQDKSVLHQYRELVSVSEFWVNDFDSGPSIVQTFDAKAVGALAPGTRLPIKQAYDNAVASRGFFQSTLKREFLGTSVCANIPEPKGVGLNVQLDMSSTGLISFYKSGVDPGAYFTKLAASSQDVMTHELLHGIAYVVACLTPSDDSGAVNEFLADFFAIALRQIQSHDPSIWTIGDTLEGFSSANPLRSFKNPHLNGFDPKSPPGAQNNGQAQIWSEHIDEGDPRCLDDELNGCAHINSGILASATYRAADGFTVDGTPKRIDMQRLVSIFNSALTLSTGTVCMQSFVSTVLFSCEDLAKGKEGGITTSDCNTLAAAFKNVGVVPMRCDGVL